MIIVYSNRNCKKFIIYNIIRTERRRIRYIFYGIFYRNGEGDRGMGVKTGVMAVLVLFLASCVTVEQPVVIAPVTVSSCSSELIWEKWYSDVLANNPPSMTEQRLVGEELQNFLNFYNSMPPVTDDNPELVTIFRKDAENIVLVVFIENDCVTRVIPVPEQALPPFLRRMAL